ncbi:hypothetical protein OAQ52_02125, partial [Candidatus Pelagibacter sp.]|nr:hypothetical protein [Candidatus Pelagibacter sp.]
MSETEVKVPNIGDFKDVEVIEVLVSEGQILKKNDPLITIESDKSSVEIPSNFEGKIKSLRTKVGDEITGYTKILKKTNTLIFLFCELRCNDKIITSASGVWKILKV